jgi:hypothetical protein
VRDGTLKRSTFRSYMTPLRREVERLLEVGSQCGVAKTEGTCREILKRRKAVSQNNFSKSMLLLYAPMRDYLVLGDAVMRYRFSVKSDVP